MTIQKGVGLEIMHAKRVREYEVELEFSDGHRSLVDFAAFLSNSLNSETRQFRDKDKFETFRIEWSNLVWGDYEMCFPIEDLYANELIAQPLLAVAEDRATYGNSQGVEALAHHLPQEMIVHPSTVGNAPRNLLNETGHDESRESSCVYVAYKLQYQ